MAESTRPGTYDYSSSITNARVPQDDPKLFGVIQQSKDDNKIHYVAAEDRDKYTPKARMDEAGNLQLARPDGSLAHLSKTEYVVIKDEAAPGGERFMINFDRTITFGAHAAMASGQGVKYAGTMDTDANGRITHMDGFSGHYKTPEQSFYDVVKPYLVKAIEDNGALDAKEKIAQIDELNSRPARFAALRNDKFGPFMNGYEAPSRPQTPPLRLEEYWQNVMKSAPPEAKPGSSQSAGMKTENVPGLKLVPRGMSPRG